MARKILVADDSATVRNSVSDFLRSEGLIVDVVSDGQEAFEVIAADGEIGLAIIDVNMPHMDGLALVEKIQSELPDANLSCIMLTTEFEDRLKQRGKRAGVKGWIIKPFNGPKSIQAIRKMLG